jgi:nitrogen fixation protein NifU and related proteins
MQPDLTPYSHAGSLWTSDAFARIHGPCGDTVCFWLKVDRGRIYKARFTTNGCEESARCCNAAAKLIEYQPVEAAANITQQQILETAGPISADHHHCALLAANTIKEALNNQQKKRSLANHIRRLFNRTPQTPKPV